jgi:phycoerythrocyanin beta chain
LVSQKQQIFRSYKQMLDAFSRVVDQADRKGAYLSDDELNALKAMVADSNKRLDVVNRLTANASSITANAYRALVAEQPQVFGPGGPCFHHRNQAACIRDLGFVLRYVTYAVATGDASALDERCLNGLRETYAALGTPGATVASGIHKIKDASLAIANDANGITKGDCSALMSEVAGYFDRAAAAVV